MGVETWEQLRQKYRGLENRGPLRGDDYRTAVMLFPFRIIPYSCTLRAIRIVPPNTVRTTTKHA
jgi:hypothetical protein